jgi:hypothetical protein
MQVSRRARTKKDVKNEGRSDYVYENKGACDKMSGGKRAYFGANQWIAGPSERRQTHIPIAPKNLLLLLR